MAAEFDLKKDETIVQEIKGDYWQGSIFSSQKTGKYCFTNQRILFRGGFATTLDLAYSDISEARLCNVGGLIKFMPTGILVTMKDGKKHRLSVLKRKSILELIQSRK